MGNQFTRRTLLVDASGFIAAPLVASAETAAGSTRVAALFDEWQRLHAYSNEEGISDEEGDRRCDVELVCEQKLMAEPAIDAADLARKILVLSGFGRFVVDPCTVPEFWREVATLGGLGADAIAGQC